MSDTCEECGEKDDYCSHCSTCHKCLGEMMSKSQLDLEQANKQKDYFEQSHLMTLEELNKVHVILEKANKDIDGLKDFAIWMTGCGYDFTQHDYFCKQRDKYLKDL